MKEQADAWTRRAQDTAATAANRLDGVYSSHTDIRLSRRARPRRCA